MALLPGEGGLVDGLLAGIWGESEGASQRTPAGLPGILCILSHVASDSQIRISQEVPPPSSLQNKFFLQNRSLEEGKSPQAGIGKADTCSLGLPGWLQCSLLQVASMLAASVHPGPLPWVPRTEGLHTEHVPASSLR